jgi:hypothetical protein
MADLFGGNVPVAATVEADAHLLGVQTEGGSEKLKQFTKDQVAALSGGATATMSGVQPNVPAVNANQTYTVSSNSPFVVGQYIALAGITGVFQVASLSGSTLLELKNISATAGTADRASQYRSWPSWRKWHQWPKRFHYFNRRLHHPRSGGNGGDRGCKQCTIQYQRQYCDRRKLFCSNGNRVHYRDDDPQ